MLVWVKDFPLILANLLHWNNTNDQFLVDDTPQSSSSCLPLCNALTISIICSFSIPKMPPEISIPSSKPSKWLSVAGPMFSSTTVGECFSSMSLHM